MKKRKQLEEKETVILRPESCRATTRNYVNFEVDDAPHTDVDEWKYVIVLNRTNKYNIIIYHSFVSRIVMSPTPRNIFRPWSSCTIWSKFKTTISLISINNKYNSTLEILIIILCRFFQILNKEWDEYI